MRGVAQSFRARPGAVHEGAGVAMREEWQSSARLARAQSRALAAAHMHDAEESGAVLARATVVDRPIGAQRYDFDLGGRAVEATCDSSAMAAGGGVGSGDSESQANAAAFVATWAATSSAGTQLLGEAPRGKI